MMMITRKVMGSLVLATVTTGLVIACGGDNENNDALLGPVVGDGGTSPDAPSTTDGRINPNPNPNGAGAAYCDATIGKFVGTYGKCCSAQDKEAQEYKLTVGLFTAAMATCVPQLDEGLASGRLAYDASAAATCYPAYATFIDSFPCGFPVGLGSSGSNESSTPPSGDLASCSNVFTGLVGVDGACRGDHECSSGLTCVGWTGTSDGVCKQPPAIGAVCGEGRSDGGVSINLNIRFGFGDHPKCAAGAWCSNRTCKALAQPNGQCSQNDECPSGLKCLQRVCSSGTPSDLSGPCKSTTDCKSGLYCDQPTFGAAGTCQTKKSANEACGSLVLCKGRCERADGSTNGTCKAYCGSE